MPLYEYECSKCGYVGEHNLPLARCNEKVYCDLCFIPMRKLFNKLTTSWKDKDRKWGTSLYRRGGK
jgi:putative FmdB family regulatory protein